MLKADWMSCTVAAEPCRAQTDSQCTGDSAPRSIPHLEHQREGLLHLVDGVLAPVVALTQGLREGRVCGGECGIRVPLHPQQRALVPSNTQSLITVSYMPLTRSLARMACSSPRPYSTSRACTHTRMGGADETAARAVYLGGEEVKQRGLQQRGAHVGEGVGGIP